MSHKLVIQHRDANYAFEILEKCLKLAKLSKKMFDFWLFLDLNVYRAVMSCRNVTKFVTNITYGASIMPVSSMLKII